jgi:glutaredoxin
LKKIIVLLVLGAFYWAWSTGKFNFQSKVAAIDSAGRPMVWVFTHAQCGGVCTDVILLLVQRQVPFEEKRLRSEDRSGPDFDLWNAIKTSNNLPFTVAGTHSATGFYKPDLTELLGKTFGDTYLTGTEKRYFSHHFYADGAPRIVMYGASWCPYCKKLREEFTQNQIDFIEIDADQTNEKALMAETMGIRGYPTVWVGYERVRGTSLADVNRVLQKL